MTYEEQVHRLGRATAAIAVLLLFMPPLVISIYYDIFPPFRNVMVGLATVSMVYLPIAVAEFLTFTPMLGSSASYLVFVTGNLSNLKIPCALTCIENADVKPQSPEAEVVATIAVAVSSLVTTAIIILGLIALVPLTPVLESEMLQPAFQQIIPALFGALGAYWILKEWRLAIIPIGVILLIFLTVSIPAGSEGALIPVMGLISVLGARQMYKRGWLGKDDEKEEEAV